MLFFDLDLFKETFLFKFKLISGKFKFNDGFWSINCTNSTGKDPLLLETVADLFLFLVEFLGDSNYLNFLWLEFTGESLSCELFLTSKIFLS